jgi:hypothetical protein
MLLGCVMISSVLGCKASASVKINDGEKPAEEPESQAVQNLPDAPTTSDYIGIARGLSLTPQATTTAQCRCMSVVIGVPNSPSFQWVGPPPSVGSEAFVMAISAEGTPCSTKPSWKPSIRAVEQTQDNNVIVTLEAARPGVPQALGAVIERPTAGAAQSYIYFQAPRNMPYADALPNSDTAQCRIPIPQ